MNDPILTFEVFLGTGGPRPGLTMVRSESLQTTRLLDLPPGQSVYAIDVNGEEGLVAAGTRGGRIDLLPWPDSHGSAVSPSHQSLVQGAPVLAVCFTGRSRLASADTAGRCLLWDPLRDADSPQVLDTGDGCVCALQWLPTHQLAGLCSDGRLVFWGIPEGGDREPLHVLHGPRPAEKLALVRLCYWPDQRALVYPSSKGEIVTCTIDDLALRSRPAHEGEFQASVVAAGGELLTIGREDGLLKVWDDTEGCASQCYRAPRGIVSADVLGRDLERLLLVADNGAAGVYALESDPLEQVCRLDLGHHRVVVGLPALTRQAHEHEQRVSSARELVVEIRAKTGRGQIEGVDSLHQRLVSLGFERTSLALRAQFAAQQEDVITELGVRRALVSVLAANEPESRASALRYATVLETVWQLPEALRAYTHAGADNGDADRVDRLGGGAEIMGGDDWVVEPDVLLPLLIEASSVIDRPFVGRWLVDRSPRVALPEARIRPEDLVQKYEDVRLEDGRPGLPSAKARTLWWLSRNAATQVETVLFEAPEEGADAGLQLAVQIKHDGLQSVLTSSVVFHAHEPRPGQTTEAHNRQALLAFKGISQGDRIGWITEVRRVVSVALRRLRTQALSLWHA